MHSHNAQLTQRIFTSLILSVQDQVTTPANNFSVVLHAASQVQGPDESAASLVFSVLRGFERGIATMSRSNCQLRSAVLLRVIRAPDVPKEHAAYDRLRSSTPPQEEYQEPFASSSGDIFGLGYGIVDKSMRSLRDCMPSPVSLSASTSFAAMGLPQHTTSIWLDARRHLNGSIIRKLLARRRQALQVSASPTL